jgi:hypothetical protein
MGEAARLGRHRDAKGKCPRNAQPRMVPGPGQGLR